MTPKETLDTLLGYLGFAVQIEEQDTPSGPVLQIYTSDAELLIGPRGETLDHLQYLLNRLLQAEDPAAPRISVDVEHHRAMRNDRLVEKIRQMAVLAVESGRPIHTEPLNAYDRWVVHQAFKDDPQIATSSDPGEAPVKKITLRRRESPPA